jgi:hypothetical protein
LCIVDSGRIDRMGERREFTGGLSSRSLVVGTVGWDLIPNLISISTRAAVSFAASALAAFVWASHWARSAAAPTPESESALAEAPAVAAAPSVTRIGRTQSLAGGSAGRGSGSSTTLKGFGKAVSFAHFGRRLEGSAAS